MRAGQALMGAAMAMAMATAAHGQSASDFRLPEPSASPTARPQGPVDPDNPILVLPRTTPSASPVSVPAATSSQPVPNQPQATSGQPRPVTQTRPADPAPRQTPPPTMPEQTEPADLATALPSIAASPDTSAFPQSGPPLEVAPAATEFSGDAPAAWWLLWLAVGSALAAALFALLWWRRIRLDAEPVIEFERPMVAPAPALPDQPEPQIPDGALPASGHDGGTDQMGLDLKLEVQRLNASLVATTLSYRVVVTNRGTTALSALAIEGDMIAAHASLPPERQVAQPDQRLELRHALSALAPGESAEFSGDIRLLLSAITPIRAGDAAYFVPLARFRIEAGEADGHPQVLAQTFVIGETQGSGGGGLRPFRLDLGPRNYSRIDQRAVN